MLQKMKKKLFRKKGFTLIEVIVVLVILAILAAIGIPALTGYIEKANERAIISEARQVQVALQEIITDEYAAKNPITSMTWDAAVSNTSGNATSTEAVNVRVGKLVGKDYATNVVSDITIGTNNQLTGFKYTEGGKTATYNGTKYTVS